MISSLTHMLACIKGIKYVAQTRSDVDSPYKGLQIKQTLLNLSLLSTIGLVGFFLQHRLLCHRMGKITLINMFLSKKYIYFTKKYFRYLAN